MGDSVNVHVTYTDRRVVEIKAFNDEAATSEFTRLLRQASLDGYVIKDVVPITSGHQRDPYTTGARITMERREPPKAALSRDRDRPRAFS